MLRKRFFPVVLSGLVSVLLLTCNKDDSVNPDAGKEIARIFLVGATDMDVEEVRGAPENDITCQLVQTLGPGIQVTVWDANNRRFQLEVLNVFNTGFMIRDGSAAYVSENGTVYESNGATVIDVEISWQNNLEMCEFTFKAKPNPVALISQNTAETVHLDSLRIQTLREDTL